MTNALEVLRVKFAEFCAKVLKRRYLLVGFIKDHSWLMNQQTNSVKGLQNKVHSMGTYWQKNLALLKGFLLKKWGLML